jgi:hypothetical protein
MATSTPSIRLRTLGGRTYLEVEGWIDPMSGIRVDSSSICHHPKAGWPPGLEAALKKRRRDGAANKGRVLYAFQVKWPSGKLVPIGALLLHLDGSSVAVLGVGTARDAMGPIRRAAVVLLLACAQEVARRNSCGCLEWVVHSQRAAADVCREHGFLRVKRTDRRMKRQRRNEFLLERPNRD